MIKNYFKIAARNLWKNKTFSFINIFGLAVGLAAFLFIALYVFDELTYDRFHENATDIYRVILTKKSDEGKETKIAGAGFMVSAKGKTDIPEIRNSVRIASFGRTNVSTTENKQVLYEDFHLSNSGFLQTFSFKVLQGDRNNALSNPHSVILTEEMAQKLFHTTDVLGKAIVTNVDSIPFKITAVLQNFPLNSHLSFNLVFSESTFLNGNFKEKLNNDWAEPSFSTYFLLTKNADPKLVESKLGDLVNKNVKSGEKGKNNYSLQPLKDVHFYSDDIQGDLGNQGKIIYIYVFSAVAIFILLIACINYMNLTTARFANRTKEIAVRKVTGASRKNLAVQFLSESFLVTGIALFVALAIVTLLLPSFNTFTEKQLSLSGETDFRIWIGIALVVIVVGLLSGTYPAWFQSRLQPLLLLRNKIYIGKSAISLRRALVVFQFVLSIIMIISTLVIYLQMKYVNTKDMGFKKDQLLVVDINSGKVRRDAQTIKNEFSRLPQVKSVSITSRVPGEWKNIPTVKAVKEGAGNTAGNDMYFLGVDNSFINTYQVKLLSGRNFRADADSSSIMINETAAKLLGIRNASEQLVEIPSANFGGQDDKLNVPFRAKVVGIVKDFNFRSLHEPLSPMIIANNKNPIHNIDYFTVKISGNNAGSTLKQMENVLYGIDPDHLFEYHFLDKQWELFYRQDKIRETIFMTTALLTILIACLGLFGLASYAAEQRIKEIGIRKVLGASVAGITALLSTDFLKLVLISILIASPLAWIFMNNWLFSFAYRIHLSWWIFALAGIIAVAIAILTVSYQAIKAAMANPVKSLRTE